jgi:Kdo2-lipid IVA lauroyltransferase/acyltransferase
MEETLERYSGRGRTNRKTKRNKKFFQYWFRDTAFGLLSLSVHNALKLLSIDQCSAVGAFIVRFTKKAYPASAVRGQRNWRVLRPEAADDASTDAAMHRLWRSISRTMCEFSVLHRLWGAGRISVTGVEHLDAARNAGRPRLVACVHLGNWETIPVALIGVGHPGSGIYLPLENRFDTYIAVKVRERCGEILYPGDGPGAMRAAIRDLTRNEGVFVFFVDEEIRGRVQAPEFGRQPRTDGNMAYVARLAARTGAEIIPAYCMRLDDSAHFQVHFLPPVPLARGGAPGDLMTNMAAINAVIEPIIRAHLDQWFYALDFEFE